MTRSAIRKASAAMDVVEAAHSGSGDLRSWADRVAEGASHLFRVSGVTLALVERQVDRVRGADQDDRRRDERAPAEDDGGHEREHADRDEPDANDERIIACFEQCED